MDVAFWKHVAVGAVVGVVTAVLPGVNFVLAGVAAAYLHSGSQRDGILIGGVAAAISGLLLTVPFTLLFGAGGVLPSFRAVLGPVPGTVVVVIGVGAIGAAVGAPVGTVGGFLGYAASD